MKNVKNISILIVGLSLGFFSNNYFAKKEKETLVTEFENNSSAVRNAFKIGCELAYLKNDLGGDKNICNEYLNQNKELLRLLIDKNKIRTK